MRTEPDIDLRLLVKATREMGCLFEDYKGALHLNTKMWWRGFYGEWFDLIGHDTKRNIAEILYPSVKEQIVSLSSGYVLDFFFLSEIRIILKNCLKNA